MKILIADDHSLVREAIMVFLSAEGFTDVTGVNSRDDAIVAVERTEAPFDLVLLDYEMPGMNGLSGFARMQALMGDRPVAMLSGSVSQPVARQALEVGVKGFLPKTLTAKSMAAAIRFIAAGGVFAPYDLMAAEVPKPAGNLTHREAEVLTGLCQGKSNKEIANDLSLQEVTIKLHVKTLWRRLGAKNRTQAAMIGHEAQIAR